MHDMRTVGVRELKTHTSRLLRDVIGRGETIDVTHRGRTIARIIPVRASEPAGSEADAVWTDLDRLAVEIAARWPADVTAPDAAREGRREL